MGKSFHELTRAEYAEMVQTKMTYDEIEAHHPQPEWCIYPFATRGFLGCWALMSFLISGPEDCEGCEYYKALHAEEAQDDS